MKTGKKRIILALFLALTMIFSISFGTVGALAHGGGFTPPEKTYKINVSYKYGSTIATGPQISVKESALSWQWWGIVQVASYTVTEDYANAAANPGKDKAAYGIVPGTTTTVWFTKGQHWEEDAVFCLSKMLPYTIQTQYMLDGTPVGAPLAYAAGTFLEGSSKNVTVTIPVLGGYKWAASETGSKTVTINKTNRNPLVLFDLAELGRDGYSVVIRYINSANSQQVGSDVPVTSGTFVEGTTPFPVDVDGRGTVPAGYQLAAGEDGLDSVTVGGEGGLIHIVPFSVTQIPASYTYIVHVEYRYNGNLVRTGNDLSAAVYGFNPVNVTVAPDTSLIPQDLFLLGTDPQVVMVSASDNLKTVVFELTSDEVPLAIPDEEVPLAEPTTGAAPDMLLTVLGIALAIGAIGVSAANCFRQRKSAK